MYSVFVDKDGKILFVSANVDINQGNAVHYQGKSYFVDRKIFDVETKNYEFVLREADGTDEVETVMNELRMARYDLKEEKAITEGAVRAIEHAIKLLSGMVNAEGRRAE